MANENITETVEFHANFGWFYYAWAITEAAVDCSIGKFLRLNFQATHILTAGMPCNRKAMLLHALIVRNDHKNKTELIRTLNVIQNESMRNIFAHSYITSDAKALTFIGRCSSGPYKAKNTILRLKSLGMFILTKQIVLRI